MEEELQAFSYVRSMNYFSNKCMSMIIDIDLCPFFLMLIF